MNLLVRSRLVSWGTLALFGLAALQLSWIGFRWGGESYQALIGNALTFLPSLVAAPLALTVAFKYHGEARRGWLFIGLGVTAQAVGNGFWSYFELVGADPFPSIADVFYLLFGPLFAAGLWQLTPTLRNRLEGVNSAEDAPPAAERLTRAFALPLQVGDHTLHITASIGVVTGGGNRGGAEDVLSDADIAMYRAKAAGGSRHVVFEPTMREATQARMALEGDLRRALEHEEFEAYYQPVIHAESGKISGFEALVRWHHPERGLVAPADFVPVAEETGLIIELDRWVLRRVCEQLAAWSALNPDLSLSVNLSSRQFASTDLAPFIAGVLAKTGLEPQRLKLELTESLLMDASTPVRGTLAALKQLGVRLHIDDFGTGYSSLGYLQRFDADVLKVDRSFVTKMLESEDSAELVRTIINMAHNLGMQVVAEGVESEEQFARLRALGCEYAQGYLFSKPVPAAVAEDFLRPEAVAVVA